MFKDKDKISKGIFKDYGQAIDEKNRIELGKICILGGAMSFLIFIVALFVPALSGTKYLYLYGTVVGILFYLINDKLPFSRPLFYLFMGSCHVYAIGLAVSAEVATTASFCVFLVVLPTFLIDKRWHVYLFQTFMLAAYYICLLLKGPQADLPRLIVDGLVFYIFSLLVYNAVLNRQLVDLSEHEEMKKKVEIDALTDLATRGALEQCIEEYISDNMENAAFILLDIDNFKGINDNFGHKAGDELLHQTGTILKKQFRKSDYIGRLGGDEFVVFLPKIHNRSWLVGRLEMLVEDMNRTFIGDEAICMVTASIGIAMYPKDGTTFDELYRNADHAMYESKKNGKNKYTIHEDE